MSLTRIQSLCEPGTVLVSEYINTKTPVLATCHNGHRRKIIPGNLFYRGSGAECLECKGILANGKKSTSNFTDSLKNKYGEYWTLDGEYLGANFKHIFKCSNGHSISQYANAMLSRDIKCTDCEPKSKRSDLRTSAEFQEFLDPLNLTLVSEYQGAKVPVIVKCQNGHEYSIEPHNLITHATGAVCRTCNPSQSKPQEEIVDFIKQNYSGWIEINDRTILEGLELDIVLPDLGVAFEINGDYFHSSKFKSNTYHQNKTNLVEAFGYQLCHISLSDWECKTDIIKSRIKSILGCLDKIYARKCIVRRIDFPKEFLNKNHLQGAGVPTKHNYGLFHKDELVAVMTFGKARFGNEEQYDYELYRYCSLLNISVTGGAGKLLKAFISEVNPKSVYTYAARDWSQGRLYEALGFTKVKYTEPGYYYIKNDVKYSRHKFTKAKLADLFPNYYSKDLPEHKIMELAGYYRVFDSGNILYGFRNLCA